VAVLAVAALAATVIGGVEAEAQIEGAASGQSEVAIAEIADLVAIAKAEVSVPAADVQRAGVVPVGIARPTLDPSNASRRAPSECRKAADDVTSPRWPMKRGATRVREAVEEEAAGAGGVAAGTETIAHARERRTLRTGQKSSRHTTTATTSRIQATAQ